MADVLIAAITFPVSFFIARGCLRALVRLTQGRANRDVL